MSPRTESWLKPLDRLLAVVGVFTAVGVAAVVADPIVALLTSGHARLPYEVTIPADRLDGLRADPGVLRPGVEFSGDVGVTLAEPNVWQTLLAMVAAGLPPVLLLIGIIMLRRIVRMVLADGPFTAAVAARLRGLGVLTVLGALGASVVSLVADLPFTHAVLASGFALSWQFPLVPIACGLGVLVVAEIVAHGVTLREDVEGTV
ncbi:DUF2975 domain-containing protein [Marinactinospora rubrisoli]|uniref:DUF2975 domain-containing protein n=1 Tax=Marinactinospora rubrisoli TaxID=2715399 RepID=A0ABW2KBP4_9ACTN